MFCKECGNKMSENDIFCGECGTKNDQIQQASSGGERGSTESKGFDVNSVLNHPFIKKNKKILAGVGIALVVIILAMNFMGGNSPEAAMEDFFRAIDSGNASAVLELLPNDEVRSLRDMYGPERYRAELSRELVVMSEQMAREYGDEQWIRRLSYETLSESNDFARVEVTFRHADGFEDRETFDLIKIDGEWKLDNF